MRIITVLTLILFMMTSFTTKAQTTKVSASVKKSDEIKNRIIIMTDEQELFTVFLNSKKETPKPGTKHVFENLDRQSYDLKIDFYRNVTSINKKLIVKEGKETTYKLRKLSPNQYAFLLFNEKDLPNNKQNQKATANLTGTKTNGAAEATKPKPEVKEEKNHRIILYSEGKELFTVFLNGEKVTPRPGVIHTFENLDRQSYDLKIDFYRNIPSITKKLIIKEGKETTYKLKKLKPNQFAFLLDKEKDLPNNKQNQKATANLTGTKTSGASEATKPKPEVKEEKNHRIIIYSEGKELFTVFLNSKKVTPKPGVIHTFENLDRQSYDLKIDFYRNIPSITKKLIIKEGKETTYILKKIKNGQFAFLLEKEKDLPGKKDEKHNLMGPQGSQKPHNSHHEQNNANVKISVNTDIKVGGADAHVKGSATVNSNSHKSAVAQKPQPKPKKETVYTTKPVKDSNHKKPAPTVSQPTETETPAPIHINTNVDVSSKSCGMNLNEYREAVLSIHSKSMDNAKLTMAKQVADNYCLTASQIKVIMEQFSYEATRLDFAKYAYVKCDNKNQYYKVNDAFEYESSVGELDKHMKKKNF